MGTEVETASVLYLQQHGFPEAERLALAGANDQGDIRLRRGPIVIAECKRAQRGIQLAPWMRELDREMGKAGAMFGILIMKQRGVGDRRVGRRAAAMDSGAMLRLMELAQARTPDGWWAVETVSPMHLNSRYVPSLIDTSNKARNRREPTPTVSARSEWMPLPFASTYAIGAPDRPLVVGPLEQFMILFKDAGLAEEDW